MEVTPLGITGSPAFEAVEVLAATRPGGLVVLVGRPCFCAGCREPRTLFVNRDGQCDAGKSQYA